MAHSTSEHYINQRFTKALSIVEHLPASSSFQPTKEEKLRLYGLFKQASEGDIVGSRPGVWDVVGRAKWDAWKRLEGMNSLEAKRMYVEALLNVATETLKRSNDVTQAQSIIQAFSTMRPSGDETDSYDEEGEYSAISEDYSENEEEERAYLSAIERDSELMRQMQPSASSRPASRTARDQGSRQYQPPPSTSSAKSPTVTPQQFKGASQHRAVSPSSEYRPRPSSQVFHSPVLSSTTSVTHQGPGRSARQYFAAPESFHSLSHQASRESLIKSDNPWAQQEPVKYQRVQQYRQQMSEEDALSSRAGAETPISHMRLPPSDYTPIPTSSQKLTLPIQAPISQRQALMRRRLSTSTSEIANVPDLGRALMSPVNTEQAASSVVALGPATKRALENLQHEIVSLNSRIDDLKEELVERNTIRQRRTKSSNSTSEAGSDDDNWDTWRWVLKAAFRHAFVNIVVAILFFLLMYKRKSPIAFAIISRVRGALFSTMRIL
ncbi:acyl CoA binding protein-domain-containing protein [Umbelopsis sp. PMI_123]|nr:acyl CoA binding protein-domain-containing protein [Umbelopsis sp. PMI_123]